MYTAGNPKISVIVPIYNNERYLPKCLTSIVGQTYRNLEIILIDDGSTDGSADICREFQKSDKRIIYRYKENGGPAGARNMGMEIATGDYLAFVDSDDWVDPVMYEKMMGAAQVYKPDFVQCGFAMTMTEHYPLYQNRVDSRLKPERDNDSDVKIYTGREAARLLFEGHGAPVPVSMCVVCNKLFRRDFIDNIRFPDSIFEDQFVTLPSFYVADTVAVIPDAFYYYRKNPNGRSIAAYTPRFIDEVLAFESLLKLFADNNETFLYEQCLKKMFHLIAWHYTKSEVLLRNKDTLPVLRYKARKYLFRFLRLSEISRAEKTGYILFAVSPTLFFYANYRWIAKRSCVKRPYLHIGEYLRSGTA